MRLWISIFLIAFFSHAVFAKKLPLNQLKLPPGFKIEIFAEGIIKARALAEGTNGTIFVGSSGDKVYAITKTSTGTRIRTIASGLNKPNGIAFRNGALYVAENTRILRYDDIENRLDNPPAAFAVRFDIPADSHHWQRNMKFGPDDKIYLGIGMPCNVCLPSNTRYGTIVRMTAEGTNLEIYAKGVRNSVGFDWDPTTQKFWFTDNGRDGLGDNIPPDKLNYAPEKGMHFGFPYYNGKGLPDPEFGDRFPESNFTMPTYPLPAHVAALGLEFYKGTQFPSVTKIKQKASQAFIAEHGSWNRSSKIGYQVIRVWICGNSVVWEEPFVTGWLQGQTAWGRPVALLTLKDGSLLISDDFANVIYRVTFQR